MFPPQGKWLVGCILIKSLEIFKYLHIILQLSLLHTSETVSHSNDKNRHKNRHFAEIVIAMQRERTIIICRNYPNSRKCDSTFVN